MPTDVSVWEQYGFPGLIVGVCIYAIIHLGRYAIDMWLKSVASELQSQAQSIEGLAQAIQHSTEQQSESWKQYDLRSRQLVRAIAQLTAKMAENCPLVNTDDIPWHLVNGGDRDDHS